MIKFPRSGMRTTLLFVKTTKLLSSWLFVFVIIFVIVVGVCLLTFLAMLLLLLLFLVLFLLLYYYSGCYNGLTVFIQIPIMNILPCASVIIVYLFSSSSLSFFNTNAFVLFYGYGKSTSLAKIKKLVAGNYH